MRDRIARIITASIFALTALVFVPRLSCDAQTQMPGKNVTDTLQMMRDFVQICNIYKRLPLQMTLTIDRSAIPVHTSADTVHITALFSMQKEGSYVKMGDLEQIVNDSLLLVVSKDTKQMNAYRNNMTTMARMNEYLQFSANDSSVTKLLSKYAVKRKEAKADTGQVVLNSRMNIQGTSLPIEEVWLVYRERSKEPVSVEQINRLLQPISKQLYDDLSRLANWDGKLVFITQAGYFLVKEQKMSYAFGNISHRSDVPLPVKLENRIVASKPGKYEPVSTYSDFALTQNF
jgi:hypothetical protein